MHNPYRFVHMQPTMQAQHISSTEPSHNINPTTSYKVYPPIADPCCNSASDLQYKNHFPNLEKQCMLQDQKQSHNPMMKQGHNNTNKAKKYQWHYIPTSPEYLTQITCNNNSNWAEPISSSICRPTAKWNCRTMPSEAIHCNKTKNTWTNLL